MFIKNCWYVAAWDKEIPAAGFLARTVINVPLVLWRDSNGAVVAFQDRCCHRGAKLSLGRQEGDCVRCMYHGLLFDKQGKCVSAPAQKTIPPQLKVQAYAVVEKHRWVWVWMGDQQLADPALIPDTPWLDHPDWRSQDGYLHYDSNYLLIADNLLDFSHLPFVHPNTLGGSADYAAVLPEVELRERGVSLSKWVRNTEPPAYSAKYSHLPVGSKVDRWMFYDFLAPGILLMDSGMCPAGADISQGLPEHALAFRGCQALTPESEHSTHYFFAHPHNFLLDQPAVTRAIHQSVIAAFEEDRAFITSQDQNLRLDPGFKMMPMRVDVALHQFRRIVSNLLQREQE